MPSKRLAFIYLLSDIAHAFKGRINPFIAEFEYLLSPMVEEIMDRCDAQTSTKVSRTLKVWIQRKIFDPKLIHSLIDRIESNQQETLRKNATTTVAPATPPRANINNGSSTTLLEAIQRHDAEVLEDMLTSASAAPFLSSNSSLPVNIKMVQAHEARLLARQSRLQVLIGLLTDRLDQEKEALQTCIANLNACKVKLGSDPENSPSSKRQKT